MDINYIDNLAMTAAKTPTFHVIASGCLENITFDNITIYQIVLEKKKVRRGKHRFRWCRFPIKKIIIGG